MSVVVSSRLWVFGCLFCLALILFRVFSRYSVCDLVRNAIYETPGNQKRNSYVFLFIVFLPV